MLSVDFVPPLMCYIGCWTMWYYVSCLVSQLYAMPKCQVLDASFSRLWTIPKCFALVVALSHYYFVWSCALVPICYDTLAHSRDKQVKTQIWAEAYLVQKLKLIGKSLACIYVLHFHPTIRCETFQITYELYGPTYPSTLGQEGKIANTSLTPRWRKQLHGQLKWHMRQSKRHATPVATNIGSKPLGHNQALILCQTTKDYIFIDIEKNYKIRLHKSIRRSLLI